MLVKEKYTNDRCVNVYTPPLKPRYFKVWDYIKYRFRKFFELRSNINPINHEYYSSYVTSYDLAENKLVRNADIIHLHWVADFLDYKSFFNKVNKPIFWTFHDLNPILGGFHYEGELKRLSENQLTTEKRIAKIKLNCIKANNNLSFVAISKWMQSRLELEFPNHNIYYAPNGIDSEEFYPLSKDFCRQVFGIKNDLMVILFSCHSLKVERKGFHLVLEIIKYYEKRSDILFLSVGQPSDRIENLSNYHSLGKINDNRLLNIVYNLADLLLIPSLEDNLPNTIVESIMTGTPVIGSNVGGIPDLVQEYENGLLVQEATSKAFIKVINEFLLMGNVFKKNEIMTRAKIRYDLIRQGERMNNIYNNAIQ